MHYTRPVLWQKLKRRTIKTDVHGVRRANALCTYEADCLAVWPKHVDFLADPRFTAAYAAGIGGGQGALSKSGGLAIEWRVHVCCWAAQKLYKECFEQAQRNFAPFPNARLVRGRVPESLSTVDIPQVCYLSIDMNVAAPEAVALRWFWSRLSPSAPVILDDYCWYGHETQKEAMDDFAASEGVEILALPTGQGLMIKPQRDQDPASGNGAATASASRTR